MKTEAIKAIILAGNLDFERCALAARVPRSLWPVLDKSALEQSLSSLVSAHIDEVIICCDEDADKIAALVEKGSFKTISFVNDGMFCGTAGCIRNAMRNEPESLFVILPGCMVRSVEIPAMVQAHYESGADLTMAFNPRSSGSTEPGESAGIYVCTKRILEHIPEEGFFDIKEGLIPKMLRKGKIVKAVTLSHNAGNFRDWQEYLEAVSECLDSGAGVMKGLIRRRTNGSETVWVSPTAVIEKDVRIHGPAVVMDDATIASGTVVLGPCVVGRGVMIGHDTVLVNSIVWDKAIIGSNCRIGRCVIDSGASIRNGTVQEDSVVACKKRGLIADRLHKFAYAVAEGAERVNAAVESRIMPNGSNNNRWAGQYTGIWFWGLLVAGAFFWSYYHGIGELWRLCQESDEYSSGLLVPFLAVYILWSMRDELRLCSIRPCLWGFAVVAGAEVLRHFGLFFMYGSADRFSIVVCIAGLTLLLFGTQIFRKTLPVLLFLLLMLPWPHRLQSAVALPLQQWATSSAVFSLEAIGYEVVQEGNVIHVGGATVAVAEACNGLRMVTAFFVISGMVVLLIKRSWWEKLIIFGSSLPIALFCNTVRLAVTAIAFTVVGGERWEKLFHDCGGYAMMPLALGLIVVELWVMAKLIVLPGQEVAVEAGQSSARIMQEKHIG